MKKIFLLFFVISGFVANSQVQLSGQLRLQNNSATVDFIKRNGDALKTSDSALLARLISVISSGKLQVDVVTAPSTTVTATNLSTNIAQINGVTPLMGAGNTGTGSPRVTIATDQSAIPVTGTFWQATQPVSGTVTANAGTNLNTSLLALESGGNLATIAGKDFATQTTLSSVLTKLTAGSASMVHLEDVLSADADGGSGMLAVRKATPANTSGTDGDFEFLQMSAGRLWTSATIDAALPTGSNVIGAVTQSGTWNIGSITTLPTLANVTTLGTITNVVHVDDNAGSLSIDIGGTAPTLGATANVASIAGILATAPVGVYNNTPVTLTDTRFSNFQLDVNGYLKTNVTNTLTVNSHAVTNAGTFATQVDGAALTALQLIDNLPNTLGSTTSGQSGALALGAVTTAAPSYTTAQSNALSLTTAGGLRTDIATIAGTAPTTAGKIDVKAADGDVFVRQATASNLNATVVGTGTFATQVASNTAPVNTMNSASANSGVNSAMAAVFDDVSPTSITENSFGFLRMSANHNLYGTIRDAAGNERGANVTASNELLVSVNNASLAVTQATSSNLKAQVDPLTVATWGLMVEDVAETAAANLMGVGTVRRDAPASSAGTTGDNATLNTNSIGALWTSEAATADQSGYDKYYVVSGASTNAANIKASAGKVYGWYIFNANASARKVMFHNTSGTPTAGASTFFPLVIPAGSGANVSYPPGINFSSGIGITTTTGTADADATAVAAGDLIITIFYKSFQWQAILWAMLIGAILTKLENIVKRQRV